MAKARKGGFATMLQALDDGRDAKLRSKLPSWDVPGIIIPNSLSLEQCSSDPTSRYKAELLHSKVGGTLTDLTGGLGVDDVAFSRLFEKVHYCEMQTALCEAAKTNFQILGASNIEIHNIQSTLETMAGLPETDAFFVDPARRSATGSKVFLLEDCTPDVLTLLPAMCARSRVIMLKLSPMADISMVVGRIESVLPEGRSIREVHVVSSGSEVKELLVLIAEGRGWTLTVADADSSNSFCFMSSEEASAPLVLAESVEPGEILHEPKAVLMKAGCFRLPCEIAGAQKLGRDCHLYIADDMGRIAPFFKRFRILEVQPMGNASVKELGRRYPVAEVTAKGLHMSSEELRKRLGCKSGITEDGRHIHIFGCDTHLGKSLIVTLTL